MTGRTVLPQNRLARPPPIGFQIDARTALSLLHGAVMVPQKLHDLARRLHFEIVAKMLPHGALAKPQAPGHAGTSCDGGRANLIPETLEGAETGREFRVPTASEKRIWL